MSPDNRGSTVHVDHGRHQNVVRTSVTHSAHLICHVLVLTAIVSFVIYN